MCDLSKTPQEKRTSWHWMGEQAKLQRFLAVAWGTTIGLGSVGSVALGTPATGSLGLETGTIAPGSPAADPSPWDRMNPDPGIPLTQSVAPWELAAQRGTLPTLGVLHGENNGPELAQLQDRLESMGIPFQTMGVESLDSGADLRDYGLLFLANVESLSLSQVLLLEQWYNRGGRLIVSGPLATRSTSDVQQRLRNLTGAYWDQGYPLTTGLAVQGVADWVPQGSDRPMAGGVVVPIGADSMPVAVWAGTGGQRAAAITNGRTVFLGWTWGQGEEWAEFDRRWLEASLFHFQVPGFRNPRLEAQNSRPGDNVAQRLPDPLPLPPLPDRPGSSDRPRPPVDRPTPSPRPTPPPPAPVEAPPVENTPGNAPGNTPGNTPPVGDRDPQGDSEPGENGVVDPSNAVAAPSLEVEANGEPIIFLEAVAMRQELSNLLGRFQNGHLALTLGGGQENLAQAPSHHLSQSQIQALAPGLTPALTPGLPQGITHNSPQPFTPGLPQGLQEGQQADLGLKALDMTTLGQAKTSTRRDVGRVLSTVQSTLKAFPQEVAARNYDGARRQWLAARRQLWDNYPGSQPRQPEVRAIWLDRGTIVEAGSPEGLAVVFDRLQAAGINVVFFETINAGYTLYPSQVAPEQNPLLRGWDPLEAAVQLAHDRDMELHAWMWTFAVANKAQHRLLGLPPTYLGPLISRHPDWVNIDNYGRRIQPNDGKTYLDPANPAARAYLLDLITEITDRYDVDGVQLDYIRYPFQDMAGGFTFGYGKAAREQFKAQTGVDPVNLNPRSALWGEWLEFKKTQITTFVASVSDLLQATDPSLTLSVAVFPFPTHERNAKIQQDWETWARAGDVDMVVLMAYAMDTLRFQEMTEPWLMDPTLQSTLIIPGVNLPQLSDVAVLDQVQYLRDYPSAGYALFAMDHLSEPLQNQFYPSSAATGGTLSPHRDPFRAVQLRYNALEQEWDYLQAQNQLRIRPTAVETWNNHRAQLRQALATLAQQPRPAHLDRVRSLLAPLRTQLPDWFYLYALEHPYPMRAWDHRLTTLEVLLNYGERTLFEQGRSLGN